jgi:hypothetical protein
VVAAGAGIHRGDQLEFGRKFGMAGGAGNMHTAGFQRLAQGFQHLAVELGQFIEKQDALMGQADFAGARWIAAADQRHRRGGVMRAAKHALP